MRDRVEPGSVSADSSVYGVDQETGECGGAQVTLPADHGSYVVKIVPGDPSAGHLAEPGAGPMGEEENEAVERLSLDDGCTYMGVTWRRGTRRVRLTLDKGSAWRPRCRSPGRTRYRTGGR